MHSGWIVLYSLLYLSFFLPISGLRLAANLETTGASR